MALWWEAPAQVSGYKYNPWLLSLLLSMAPRERGLVLGLELAPTYPVSMSARYPSHGQSLGRGNKCPQTPTPAAAGLPMVPCSDPVGRGHGSGSCW